MELMEGLPRGERKEGRGKRGCLAEVSAWKTHQDQIFIFYTSPGVIFQGSADESSVLE